MNKHLLLSISLGISTLIALPSYATANTIVENSHQTISTLSFKEIMRTFYATRLEAVFVQDEAIEQLPHISIGQKNSNHLVAIMLPSVQYKGDDGLERHLIIIEKVEIDDEGHQTNACHACTAQADLLLFKKTLNGEYKLISHSENDELLPSSYGRINIDLEMLQNSIQPFGNNIYGGFYESSYSNHGYTESSLNFIHLNENQALKVYNTFENMELLSSEDNIGKYDDTSPLSFSYNSTVHIKNNQTNYYPIQIYFQGDKPFNNGQIMKYNQIQTIQYQPNIDKYQIIK